jgi:hypothetical protein
MHHGRGWRNRVMTRTLCLSFIVALALSSKVSALTPEDVVGTWRLVSNVRQEAGSDKVENNLGENPSGVLILTPEQRFIVLFTAADRKPATTMEERAALQNTHIAYTGLVTFEPDASDGSRLKMTNKVDIAWNAEWAGSTQVRFLSLEGSRLTIKTPLMKNAYTGRQSVSTLVFERSR